MKGREGDPHRDTIPFGHGKVEGGREREGDPHRDIIPFGCGKVEGREGGRGGPSQSHNTIQPY